MIKEIKPEELEDEINNNSTLVVLFTNPLGYDTILLEDEMEKADLDLGNRLNVVKIDFDENVEFCNKLKVFMYPTMIVYKDKRILEREIGFLSEERLVYIIKKYL